MSNEPTKPDLKELAKILSDAFYSILQYSTLTEPQVGTCLLRLIVMTHHNKNHRSLAIYSNYRNTAMISLHHGSLFLF